MASIKYLIPTSYIIKEKRKSSNHEYNNEQTCIDIFKRSKKSKILAKHALKKYSYERKNIQLIIQYQVISPENIHASDITQT